MKEMSIIKQITASGLLTSLAIVIGGFLSFPLFGGHVYLIAVVIFIMPFFLRIDMLIISTVSSVVLADVISGFGQYSWISAIAYGLAILPIWLMIKMKLKFFYFVGVLMASGIIIFVYYFLERIVFDEALAYKDFLATSLQMAIVCSILLVIYWPIKAVVKVV